MSETPPLPGAGQRSHACGCVLIVGLVLLLAFLVPAAYYLAWVVRSGRKAEAALAELRAAGEPTTPEELDALYKLPEGTRDVAALWLDAVRPLEGPEFDEAIRGVPVVDGEVPLEENEIPSPGRPWPRLGLTEKLLERYAESLGLMHEAARAGGKARYPVDLSKGIAADISHTWLLRAGARLLVLEAHVRAHRYDWSGAAESIETIQRMAGSLEYEPIVFSQLYRLALDGMGRGVVETLLPHTAWSDEELARLQAHFEGIDYGPRMVAAMRGERAMGIGVFRNPRQFDPELSDWDARLGLRNDDLAFYLDMTGKGIAAAELPSPANLDAVEQVDTEIDRLVADVQAFTRRRYVISAMLLSGAGRIVTAGARGDALARAAAAAIACERFHRRHGRPPADLAELVPEFLDAVPTDPFDGKPLRYVVREGGFVVYSIGPDRQDDGGRRYDEDDPQPWDIVFEVETNAAP